MVDWSQKQILWWSIEIVNEFEDSPVESANEFQNGPFKSVYEFQDDPLKSVNEFQDDAFCPLPLYPVNYRP